MITRQNIAAVLTTTAIAFSICTPARAASLAAIVPERSKPYVDKRDNKPLDVPAAEAETRLNACR